MIPPLTKWINDIKVKLGFSRTMTAAGADVVDAVNKHSDQIAKLTVQDTNDAFTIVSTAITTVSTNKTIQMGNILIIELLFKVIDNITDGDILFTLKDTSILFDTSQIVVANIRSITAVPFMAKANYPTRNITAWSNFTPDSGGVWCSLEFIIIIKEV